MQVADESVSVFNLCQAIVEQAADATIFADRDGAIRARNRRAEALFGYASAEVPGSSLDVIIPERLRRAHWEGSSRAARTCRSRIKLTKIIKYCIVDKITHVLLVQALAI